MRNPNGSPAQDPNMVGVAEGAMIAGVTRARLVAMIEQGLVRGEFDPSRPVSGGRWFAVKADCERLRQARDAQQRATV